MPPSDCTQQCARQRGSIIGQCALEVLQRRAVVELVEVDDLVVRVLLHEADHDVRGDEASTASDHDVLRRVVLSVAIGGALLPQPLGRRSLTVGRHELGACHRDVCVEPATHESSPYLGDYEESSLSKRKQARCNLSKRRFDSLTGETTAVNALTRHSASHNSLDKMEGDN